MDYIKKCQEIAEEKGFQEIIHFQYKRMMRYGGSWHLEKSSLLPGYIFLSRTEKTTLGKQGRRIVKDGVHRINMEEKEFFMRPCEIPYLKMLCPDGCLIDLSRGIIKNGILVVTEGPLKGYERFIKKIDRHKRIAELSIPFGEKTMAVTVGLEVYRREM